MAKCYPSRCASTIQIVHPRNQLLRRSPGFPPALFKSPLAWRHCFEQRLFSCLSKVLRIRNQYAICEIPIASCALSSVRSQLERIGADRRSQSHNRICHGRAHPERSHHGRNVRQGDHQHKTWLCSVKRHDRSCWGLDVLVPIHVRQYGWQSCRH